MRLCKPGFFFRLPVPFQPGEQGASSLREDDYGLSGTLTLPQSFGDIYLGAVEGIGRAGTVQPSGCAFQEYFTGGDFISEAGWVGPYIEAEGTGDLFVATSAVPDCDEPSTVTDCIHGAGCGAGRFETAQGHGIEKNCTEGENMWAAGAPRVAGPPPGARPLVQTPTTAMA